MVRGDRFSKCVWVREWVCARRGCSLFDKCTISDQQRSMSAAICSGYCWKDGNRCAKACLASISFFPPVSVSPSLSSIILFFSICHAQLLISSVSAGNLIKMTSRFLPRSPYTYNCLSLSLCCSHLHSVQIFTLSLKNTQDSHSCLVTPSFFLDLLSVYLHHSSSRGGCPVCRPMAPSSPG